MSSQPVFQEASFFASAAEAMPFAPDADDHSFDAFSAPSPNTAAGAFTPSKLRTVSLSSAVPAPARASTGMTALLAPARASGFARNPVFAENTATQQAQGDEVPPLQAAYDRGFTEGLHAATARAEAQEAERRMADQAIEMRFAQWDADTAKTVAERLRITVMALCEEAVLPLALDMDGLLARIGRATAMLQRATDERRVLLNPADFERLCHRLPQGLSAEPHPSVEPGGLRIETQDGGVEDGPSQWRQALAEAFHEC